MENNNVRYASIPIIMLFLSFVLMGLGFLRYSFGWRFIPRWIMNAHLLFLTMVIPIILIAMFLFGILMFKRNDTRKVLAWSNFIIGIIGAVLGIFFLRLLSKYGNFGTGKQTFGMIEESIIAEMREGISKSGELVYFSETEFNIDAVKPFEFYEAIRNTEPEIRCFRQYIECIRGKENPCDPAQPGIPIAVGGIDIMNNEPTENNRWFQLFNEVDIRGDDISVFPMLIQIPETVSPDTYLMSYEIYKTDTGDCNSPVWPTSTIPYQSKQFYIEVR